MGKKKDRGKGKTVDLVDNVDEASDDVDLQEKSSNTTSKDGKSKKRANKLELLKQMIEEGESAPDIAVEDVKEKEEQPKKKGKPKKKKEDTSDEVKDPVDNGDEGIADVTDSVAACRFDHSSGSELEKDENEPNEKGMWKERTARNFYFCFMVPHYICGNMHLCTFISHR